MPDFDPYTLSVGPDLEWGIFGKSVSNGAVAPHFREEADSPPLERALEDVFLVIGSQLSSVSQNS